MKTLSLAVIVAASIGMSALGTPARSIEFPLNTGNGLLAACTYESPDQAEVEYHFGTCIGFIKGVTNAYAISESVAGRPVPICARANVDNGQIRDVVVKALQALPEIRDQASAPIVMAAMVLAFPCER